MSKIQKALDALRENPPAAGPRVPQVSREPSGRRLREGRDQSVLMAPEIEAGTRIDVSREALEHHGLLVTDESEARLLEQQFRRAKRPILKCAFDLGLPVGENANVIMVASAMPGAGKSFCAFNLAQSIALERDVGAVLVDSDVLKPRVSDAFGVRDRVGLVDYLADSTLTIADILIQTDMNGLMLVPAGKAHSEATELLASKRMKEFVQEMSERFQNRAVIFDTPPLLVTSEAQVLAALMGQIAFVIEARVSSQDAVKQALGMLDPDKPINAILNKSRSAETGRYQSGDYGYYPVGGEEK